MRAGWRGMLSGSILGHYVRRGRSLCGRFRGLNRRKSWPLKRLRPELQREVERFDRCRSCQKKAPTP